MELKREDIVAVITEKNELVCKKCATDQEWAAVSDTSKLFREDKLKDTKSLYFCDRCNGRLKA
ncbi:MAG: hypothetical protein KAU31_16665 [Spirochaetaceae bacterium]|nr:hypothetical protein [Spirochaetaceae bacterium]